MLLNRGFHKTFRKYSFKPSILRRGREFPSGANLQTHRKVLRVSLKTCVKALYRTIFHYKTLRLYVITFKIICNSYYLARVVYPNVHHEMTNPESSSGCLVLIDGLSKWSKWLVRNGTVAPEALQYSPLFSTNKHNIHSFGWIQSNLSFQ